MDQASFAGLLATEHLATTMTREEYVSNMCKRVLVRFRLAQPRSDNAYAA